MCAGITGRTTTRGDTTADLQAVFATGEAATITSRGTLRSEVLCQFQSLRLVV
jgi:hypothetical protein